MSRVKFITEFANFFNFSAFTLKKDSTILLAFFPYLAQIIISIRGWVACNDLWPWPIFSRSFGLDLENTAASWSSGKVQDSGLGSRSSLGFNNLPVRLLVVPLSEALHAALLLSTQEEMGTCEGRFVSRGAKLRVSGCILPRELRWISRRIWTVKRPNDQGRYLSKSAEQSSEPGCGLKTVTLLYFTLS